MSCGPEALRAAFSTVFSVGKGERILSLLIQFQDCDQGGHAVQGHRAPAVEDRAKVGSLDSQCGLHPSSRERGVLRAQVQDQLADLRAASSGYWHGGTIAQAVA